MQPHDLEVGQAATILSAYEKQQSYDRFEIFCSVVRGFDNNWHHDEWAFLLQNKAYQFQDKIKWDLAGEYIIDNKWMVIMAPRSHAKSTVFTVNYPLWRLGRDHNLRIVIVSASATISQSFLREIQVEMERNAMYKAVFGNLVPEIPEKWTQHEFIVDRDRTDLKDPSVSATSIGGTVLSKRADIIICDDILSDQNTRTVEQREKVRQWFFEVLLPVLEPGGQLIVVGTAWNTEDLYHQLMGDDSFQIRKRYDAIINEDTQETMWPERWNWSELMRLKKAMGSIPFSKAYRNVVLSAEDAVFKIEWINRAKERGKHYILKPTFDYATWDLGQLVIANGIDLAISEKSTADYTAMGVLGRTRDGTKIPLWARREHLSPAEVRQGILDIHKNFAPVGLAMHKVETNGYQEALRRDLADQTDIPISGYATGGEKFDEYVGINSMAVEFENDKWIIPYGDEYTRRMMDYFIAGLLGFPGGHTEDLVMAFWFANTALRDLTAGTQDGQVQTGTLKIFGK